LRLEKVLAVAWYELGREARKRSALLVLALLLLPLAAALVVRAVWGVVERDPLMWTLIMGVDLEGVFDLGVGTLTGALSVVSWAWLVAILYGVDLFAADLEDGSVQLILSRPIARGEYVAGKVMAASLVMLAVFTVAGAGIAAAAWILAGPQERVLEAVLLGAATGIGVLPMLLLASLLGLVRGRPSQGMTAAIAVWFLGGVAAGGLTIYYASRGDPELAAKIPFILSTLLPFLGGDNLRVFIYSWLHEATAEMLVATPGTPPHMVEVYPGEYAVPALISVVLWTFILGLAVWRIVARRDF